MIGVSGRGYVPAEADRMHACGVIDPATGQPATPGKPTWTHVFEQKIAALAAEHPEVVALPFGGGARKCIGATFGMTEATLALASIIARWRFQPISRHPVRPRFRSTLVPRPVPLRVSAHP